MDRRGGEREIKRLRWEAGEKMGEKWQFKEMEWRAEGERRKQEMITDYMRVNPERNQSRIKEKVEIKKGFDRRNESRRGQEEGRGSIYTLSILPLATYINLALSSFSSQSPSKPSSTAALPMALIGSLWLDVIKRKKRSWHCYPALKKGWDADETWSQRAAWGHCKTKTSAEWPAARLPHCMLSIWMLNRSCCVHTAQIWMDAKHTTWSYGCVSVGVAWWRVCVSVCPRQWPCVYCTSSTLSHALNSGSSH